VFEAYLIPKCGQSVIHFSAAGLNPPETAPAIADSQQKRQWEMSRSAGIAQKYARSRFMRCVVMLYRRT